MLYFSNFVLESYNFRQKEVKMKRTLIIFIVAALVLISFILWTLNTRLSLNIQEVLMIVCGLILVSFAIYTGIRQVRSLKREEVPEDELTKKVMTKASSLSYYISIYLWLLIMYLSDKVKLETHSMIGGGILGMALIFLLCWLVIKKLGLKNE